MEEPEITKGEQTRQDILAAAKRLFLSQGFTATPMRQIAREVGITPAAIYNHYPSKDQLFAALLQNAAPYDEFFGLVDQIVADSAESLVRQVLRMAVAFVRDHKDYLQLAQIDAQERAGTTLAAFLPEVLPRVQMWYQRLVALDAGQRGADFRLRQIPFLVFIRTMFSLLAGFMLTERVVTADRLPQVADVDWPEALADVLLHGVLKPSDRDGEGGVAT